MLNSKNVTRQQFLLYSLLVISIYFICSNALSVWNYVMLRYFILDLVVPIQAKALQFIFLIGLVLSFFECFLFLRYRADRELPKSGIVIFICSLLSICLIYVSLYTQVKADLRYRSDLALQLTEEKQKNTKLVDIDYKFLKALNIVNLPSVADQEIFNKNLLLQADIKNFDDFYSFSTVSFKQNKKLLEQQWKLESPELLETLYFMNLIAGMWGYGNVVAVDKPGCVLVNEQTNYELLPAEQRDDIRTYIKTNIGCCRDSAYLFRRLLTKANIKNRLVAYPGHIFNEAYIDGKWMAFDATTNIWWHSSWEAIQSASKDEPFYVTLFPHNNSMVNSPYYRDSIGQFRTHLLLQATYKKSQAITHPESV